MKIKVLNTGYYDAPNDKFFLLKEGEQLDVISDSVEKKADCWQCLKEGKSVFVEKENAQVLQHLAEWRIGSDGRLYRH